MSHWLFKKHPSISFFRHADRLQFWEQTKSCGPILGIDLGTRRSGVARTDKSQSFVFPLCVIPMQNFSSRLAEIERYKSWVVGIPTHDKTVAEWFYGTLDKILSREFSLKIDNMLLYDERYTTILSKELLGGMDKDEASASIILSDYLAQVQPKEPSDSKLVC